MKLEFLPTLYSVCQLAPADPIPTWASDFFSISRSATELTIIVQSECVPDKVRAQHDFICFRVMGQIAFDVIGVIAAISQTLAAADIPILAVSTYDTDYFLISQKNVSSATAALIQSGNECL